MSIFSTIAEAFPYILQGTLVTIVLVLGALAEAVQHAALPDQVAEHKEADELRALGGHDAGDDGDENG